MDSATIFCHVTMVTTLIEIDMSTHEKTGQYYKCIHSVINTLIII